MGSGQPILMRLTDNTPNSERAEKLSPLFCEEGDRSMSAFEMWALAVTIAAILDFALSK
jgi:hypothetical protein